MSDTSSLDALFNPPEPKKPEPKKPEPKKPEPKNDTLDLPDPVIDAIDATESNNDKYIFERENLTKDDKQDLRDSFVENLQGKKRKKPRHRNTNKDVENPYAEKESGVKNKTSQPKQEESLAPGPYNKSSFESKIDAHVSEAKKGTSTLDTPSEIRVIEPIETGNIFDNLDDEPTDININDSDAFVGHEENIRDVENLDVQDDKTTDDSINDETVDGDKTKGESFDKAGFIATLKAKATQVFNKLSNNKNQDADDEDGAKSDNNKPSFLNEMKIIFSKKGKDINDDSESDLEDSSEVDSETKVPDSNDAGKKNILLPAIAIMAVILVFAIIPWGAILENPKSLSEGEPDQFIEEDSSLAISSATENKGIDIPGMNDNPISGGEVSTTEAVGDKTAAIKGISTLSNNTDETKVLEDSLLGDPNIAAFIVDDLSEPIDPETAALAKVEQASPKTDIIEKEVVKDVSLADITEINDEPKGNNTGLLPPPPAVEEIINADVAPITNKLTEQLDAANKKLASVEGKLDQLIAERNEETKKRETRNKIRYWLPEITISGVVMRDGRYYARVSYPGSNPFYVAKGQMVRKWTVQAIDSEGVVVVFGKYVKSYKLNNSITKDNDGNNDMQSIPVVKSHRMRMVNMGEVAN